MCLPKILSPVLMFAFIFHYRSFSPCWPLTFLTVSQLLWIFMFFFLQNSSLLFSTTRSCSFFQIRSKKTRLCCCFFFLKVLAAMRFFFQIKPWVTFGLPYPLIELFYIGISVVRTDGRAVGVRSRDYQIFSDGRFTTFLYPWCCAARASRAKAPLWWWWRGCHEE